MAGLTIWARQAGLLYGWPALIISVLATLAVPTSRSFSRRCLLVGMLVFGWLPVLWWWNLPVGRVGRDTILLALLFGVLGGWVAAGPLHERMVRIRPNFRLVDLYPLVTVGVGFWLLRSWLTIREASRSLSILFSGWDNVAHFAMFLVIRRTGAISDANPLAPDGSPWRFAHYPQAFHSVAAAGAELITKGGVGATEAELVNYVRIEAVIFIGLAAMLVAGICSLPRLRRRPTLAAALSSLVGSAFLFGPGAALLMNGQLNYVFVVSLCAALVLITPTVFKPLAPLPLAAICGALVAIANGWLGLLSLALPALAPLMFPLRGRRWKTSPANWVVVGLILAATAYGLFHSLSVLTALGGNTSFLSIPGFTYAPPWWRVGVICLLAVFVPLTVGVREPGRRLRYAAHARIRALAMVPLSGLVVAAVVGFIEYRSLRAVSYYFWKYLGGVELVSIVVLAFALSDTTRFRIARLGRTTRAMVLVVAGLAASQLFGYVGPLPGEVAVKQNNGSLDSKVFLLDPNPKLAPIQVLRRYSAGVADHPWREAEHLVSAVPVQENHRAEVVVYLAMTPADRVRADFMAEWYRSLTGTWSKTQDSIDYVPDFVVQDPSQAAVVVQHVLPPHPNAIIVLPPDMRQLTLTEIQDPSLRSRVVTW